MLRYACILNFTNIYTFLRYWVINFHCPNRFWRIYGTRWHSLYIKRALFTGKPDENEPFVLFELFYNISLSLAIRIRRLIRNLVCAEVKRARQEAFHFHPRVRASDLSLQTCASRGVFFFSLSLSLSVRSYIMSRAPFQWITNPSHSLSSNAMLYRYPVVSYHLQEK